MKTLNCMIDIIELILWVILLLIFIQILFNKMADAYSKRKRGKEHPLAYGYIYYYDLNSEKLLKLYSNDKFTVLKDNPIRLDKNGRNPNYFIPTYVKEACIIDIHDKNHNKIINFDLH